MVSLHPYNKWQPASRSVLIMISVSSWELPKPPTAVATGHTLPQWIVGVLRVLIQLCEQDIYSAGDLFITLKGRISVLLILTMLHSMSYEYAIRRGVNLHWSCSSITIIVSSIRFNSISRWIDDALHPQLSILLHMYTIVLINTSSQI